MSLAKRFLTFAANERPLSLPEPHPKSFKQSCHFTIDHLRDCRQRVKSLSAIDSRPLEHYIYEPLQSPDTIRILSLLPGLANDSIHITLYRHHVKDIASCETLSYEWGEPIREHPVVCAGKIINVTANLLAALRRLRLPKQSRRLWVDALCINQDDVEERNHQVQLMASVYSKAAKLLIWTGEAPPLINEAFRAMDLLADVFDVRGFSITDQDSPIISIFPTNFLRVKNGKGVLTREEFYTLPDKDYWPALIDFISKRKYFRRRWIVQEIVLSGVHADVLCGPHTVRWESLSKAVYLIYHDDLLCKDIIDLQVTNIYIISWLKNKITSERNHLHLYDLSLTLSGQHFKSFDPRDAIISLLGMAKKTAISLANYSLPTGAVFELAAQLIIAEGGDIFKTWGEIGEGEGTRQQSGPDMPSWVPDFAIRDQYSGLSLNAKQQVLSQINKAQQQTPTLTVEGHILQVLGVVLDVVTEVTPLLSDINILLKVVAEMYTNLKASAAYPTIAFARLALLEAVSGGWVDFENVSNNAIPTFRHLLFCQWLSLHELTLGVVEQNPRLQDVLAEVPGLRERFSEDILAACEDLETLLATNEAVSVLRQGFGNQFPPSEDLLECIEQLKLNLAIPDLRRGQRVLRNIFVTSQGYMGLGPCGLERDSDLPVQIGHRLIFIPGSEWLFLLRPVPGLADGNFTLTGTVYIPGLEESTWFREGGQLSDFTKLRIH